MKDFESKRVGVLNSEFCALWIDQSARCIFSAGSERETPEFTSSIFKIELEVFHEKGKNSWFFHEYRVYKLKYISFLSK